MAPDYKQVSVTTTAATLAVLLSLPGYSLSSGVYLRARAANTGNVLVQVNGTVATPTAGVEIAPGGDWQVPRGQVATLENISLISDAGTNVLCVSVY